MMSLEILDFDNIDEWATSLENALRPLITDTAGKKLAEAKLEYVEDAQDLLFTLTNQNSIIDTFLDWLCSRKIVGYHGTRVTESEISSIQKDGLIPLNAIAPHIRLIRALSSHPNWSKVEHQ